MRNLFQIFRLPAIYLFAIAAVFIYAAWFSYSDITAIEASKASAISDGIPDVVSLSEFDENIHLPAHDEVHIAASINADYNYHLSKQGDPDSYSRLMFVLFDPTETGTKKTVKSAILIDGRDEDIFFEWIKERVYGEGDLGPVFHINGKAMEKADHSDTAEDAMDKENLVRQDDFFFIEPYLDGREAALEPDPGMLKVVVGIFFVLTATFAIPGIVKARRGQLFRN